MRNGYLIPEEVEGGDVVVVHDVPAVLAVVPVHLEEQLQDLLLPGRPHLVAEAVQHGLELGQGGVGGVHVHPVGDHLQGGRGARKTQGFKLNFFGWLCGTMFTLLCPMYYLLAELALNVFRGLRNGGHGY